MKPIFAIDIAPNAPSSLEAHLPLALLNGEGTFHTTRGFRLPLGIYNVSVSRISDKVARLCQRLEAYFHAGADLVTLEASEDVMKELIDYIELTLYAAAEHVDDVDTIADGFFSSTAVRDKSPAYRTLKKEMKRCKRHVSLCANAIKHLQARIRLFSNEFEHDGVRGCLHGYFIEGVKNGAVGPNETLHSSQQVLSITTLVWEVLLFVLNSSRELARFLNAISKPIHGPVNTTFEHFSRAVVAAARLPLYTYGEEHPFCRATISVSASDGDGAPLDSGLYGSIRNRWSMSDSATFGRFTSRFEGDSSTKTFRFAQPKTVAVHHWQ